MPLYGLRARVRADIVVATTIGTASPAVVERLAASPFPALLLDAEHGPYGIGELDGALRAAAVHRRPALVRVPELGSYVGRVLDHGAAGVVVPRIETVEQAREVVGRARYAPDGFRGTGPGRAASGMGFADYLATANDDVLVAIQLETQRGLENADAILAVAGIDAVVIGPIDLSVSLGVEVNSPEHRAAVLKIFVAADRHGVARGAFAMASGDPARYLADGVRLLFTGSDSAYLRQGAAAAWAEVERHLPSRPEDASFRTDTAPGRPAGSSVASG
ncbi:HpcH/HpaI aldolase/citrate lyase family protein [Frankia sp. R82]|uniref:HpcH/HpaI aldolase family protein n=1 Tax=Frankia sp. R82 TaxID=2950553 RepID=UPI0020448616|nr:aldolase/citrate lyase family protein [Frankia sp. R82]MCM3883879.1 aldolase/citrate lyase family protein [Frankia sp. R82]